MAESGKIKGGEIFKREEDGKEGELVQVQVDVVGGEGVWSGTGVKGGGQLCVCQEGGLSGTVCTAEILGPAADIAARYAVHNTHPPWLYCTVQK